VAFYRIILLILLLAASLMMRDARLFASYGGLRQYRCVGRVVVNAMILFCNNIDVWCGSLTELFVLCEALYLE